MSDDRLRAPDYPWAVAYRLADAIIAVMNAEFAKMNAAGEIDALQLLAGHLISTVAVGKSMETDVTPPAVKRVFAAAQECLEEMLPLRLPDPPDPH
jgi:hypothetical protein